MMKGGNFMSKNVKKILVLLGALALTVALLASFYSEKHIKLNGYSANGFVSVSINELKKDKRVEFNNSLMLVNSEHPLPEGFSASVVQFEDTEAYFDGCTAESFSNLRESVNEKFGKKLLIMSSYRTREEQQEIYKSESKSVAAAPGTSEHETGLCADVYVKYYAGRGFIKSEAGRFVNKNCGDYGFIIRYPFAKKHITGYSYEPWHLRYVGQPHSNIITKNKITLEEYIGSLEPEKFYYTYEGYVISRQSGDEIKMPHEYQSAVISPDNCGYHIVTVML